MDTQIKPDRSNHHDPVAQNTTLRGGMAQTSRQLSRVHRTFQRKAEAVAARRNTDVEPAPDQVPAAVG